MKQALNLKISWEHEQVQAGKDSQRGLLIELTGRKVKKIFRKERPPLNLAVVIDRSGSMQGDRLAAARRAAIGICRQLRKQDRLSIVAYDDEALVLLNGRKQNKAGRKAAETAISNIRTGGCTDLGGGWITGSNCVAKVMEQKGLESGHVLLLSDGHANRGITDPVELAGHAGELAARGVTSSCAGIGHDYSALQLDAIAEAGHGQLHHCERPEEIVEVVLGELGELSRLAARSTRLRLHFPKNTRPKQLTAFREHHGNDHTVDLDLGDIPSGRSRKIAFMVTVSDRVESGEILPFMARLEWKDGQQEPDCTDQAFVLNAVDPVTFDPAKKNRRAARIIAELWLSRMGYDAMVLNEQGRFSEAVDTIARNDMALEDLIADLSEQQRQRLLKQKHSTQSSVSSEWSGPDKLQAFTLAKKFMRSEKDHSGRRPGDWSDGSGS